MSWYLNERWSTGRVLMNFKHVYVKVFRLGFLRFRLTQHRWILDTQYLSDPTKTIPPEKIPPAWRSFGKFSKWSINHPNTQQKLHIHSPFLLWFCCFWKWRYVASSHDRWKPVSEGNRSPFLKHGYDYIYNHNISDNRHLQYSLKLNKVGKVLCVIWQKVNFTRYKEFSLIS